MASYLHSHSHRDLESSGSGRGDPMPHAFAPHVGLLYMLQVSVRLSHELSLYVSVNWPPCLCLFVCASGCGWANFSLGTWLITHSRATATTTLQSKTTRLCALCAVLCSPHSLCSSSVGPSQTNIGGGVSVSVCVRVNACGWHNNKMLVFYISI